MRDTCSVKENWVSWRILRALLTFFLTTILLWQRYQSQSPWTLLLMTKHFRENFFCADEEAVCFLCSAQFLRSVFTLLYIMSPPQFYCSKSRRTETDHRRRRSVFIRCWVSETSLVFFLTFYTTFLSPINLSRHHAWPKLSKQKALLPVHYLLSYDGRRIHSFFGWGPCACAIYSFQIYILKWQCLRACRCVSILSVAWVSWQHILTCFWST